MVESKEIVWTPCTAYCLDLLMEDIGKLPWIAPTQLGATKIVTLFRKKHQALGIFRSHSSLDIVQPSKMRFAYMYLVL